MFLVSRRKNNSQSHGRRVSCELGAKNRGLHLPAHFGSLNGMRAALTLLIITALLVTTQWCSYANIPGPELSVISAGSTTVLPTNSADDDDDDLAHEIPTLASFPTSYNSLGAEPAPLVFISSHAHPAPYRSSLYTLNRSLLI